MLDNLNFVALVIIGIWVLALLYYLYIARQQAEIKEELEILRKLLEEREEGDGE